MGTVGLGGGGRHSAATLDTSGWDTRIYTGLSAHRVAPETRDALARALGAVGVEAEFLLILLDSFPGAARPDHHLGEVFLQRLASALMRLTDASAALEAATQGYLAALEVAYPDVSETPRDEV